MCHGHLALSAIVGKEGAPSPVWSQKASQGQPGCCVCMAPRDPVGTRSSSQNAELLCQDILANLEQPSGFIMLDERAVSGARHLEPQLAILKRLLLCRHRTAPSLPCLYSPICKVVRIPC